MGKNQHRRQQTESWSGGSDDGDGLLLPASRKKPAAAVGKKRWPDDPSSSLKKRKKKKKLKNSNPSSLTTPHSPALLRQLLGDSLPRHKRSLHFDDHLHRDNIEEERFADLSDIVATDWRAELIENGRSSASAKDQRRHRLSQEDEEIYQSRKLVMRQLVMNQLSFIRQHFQDQPEDNDEDQVVEDVQDGGHGGISDVDSWQEMEERFAEIYEPIPYNVAMDSWRSMSRDQMLKTVTSRRLRSRFNYMSRAEILSHIQTLRLRHLKDVHQQHQANANNNQPTSGQTGKRQTKSPVYEDMSPDAGNSVPPPAENKKKNTKKRTAAKEGPVYQNTSAYQGASLADIYQAKVEARRQELHRLKQEKAAKVAAEQQANGLYVTRAMVHAPPGSDDEGQQQKFLSRSTILSKLGTPSQAANTQSKNELMAQFWRQSDAITSDYGRTTMTRKPIHPVQQPASAHSCSSSSPSSSCPSDCEGCCDGGDGCSMYSCSSCAGSIPPVPADYIHRSQSSPPLGRVVEHEDQHDVQNENEELEDEGKVEEGEETTPEPVPLSLVKQRKMEFERLRILEEQESRLQELVRRTGSGDAGANPVNNGGQQSWLQLAQRARQLEDKWNRARRSSSLATAATATAGADDSHAIYEVVPAAKLLAKPQSAHSATNKSQKNKKRSKVIQQLKTRMRENLESESLDPHIRQRRHEELRDLLSDAVHAGTQTLTNINLGLIYVPMEQQLEHESASNASSSALHHHSIRTGGLMTLKTDRSQLAGGSGGGHLTCSTHDLVCAAGTTGTPGDDGVTATVTDPATSGAAEENEDLFGSIDTLIFEPKAGGSSTIRTTDDDDLDEVEERIARQFDYLNDSQYGSCPDEESGEGAGSSSDGSTTTGTTGSKNGRRAAAAAVAATVAPPSDHRNAGTASCAAAASCDASASNRTLQSNHDDPDNAQQTEEDTIHPIVRDRKKSLTTTAGGGSTLDSEHYTNGDTDASWDYYPDRDGNGGGEMDGSSQRTKTKSKTKRSDRNNDDDTDTNPEEEDQEEETAPDPVLVVGNLRKKPPSYKHQTPLQYGYPSADHQDEVEETARLLESLRMAEDAYASTSLRLIFPTNSLKLPPGEKRNIFTDVNIDDDRLIYSPFSGLPPPLDSGFQSLPEEAIRSTGDGQPVVRKRDTMIRELKSKLRDKFQCVGDDDNRSTSTVGYAPLQQQSVDGGFLDPLVNSHRPAHLGTAKKPKLKMMSKLESILSSLNALAQMNGQGRVYRTVPESLSLPAEYYTNDIDYQSTSGDDIRPNIQNESSARIFQSTGYPHHLLRHTDPSGRHHPVVGGDEMTVHYAEIPHPMEPLELLHQQQLLRQLSVYPLDMDPRLSGWYDNALFDRQSAVHPHPYPHENLYNISEPLSERLESSNKQRKRNRKFPHHRSASRLGLKDAVAEELEELEPDSLEAEMNWGQMDQQLFPHPAGAPPPTGTDEKWMSEVSHPVPNRMAPYHDEWLFWDQMARLGYGWSESDRQRWDEERSRRMPLWAHQS